MTTKSTEERLREALERLKTRTPNTKSFKQKVKANKPLRITNSGVEKEAGLSNGCLKRYPNIASEIQAAEAERVHGGSSLSQEISVDDVKSSAIYKQLEAKLIRVEKAKKEAEAKVKDLAEERDRKDAALNEKVAEIDELITSMWELIPRDQQREVFIEKAENIVRFEKR
ncbi:hypothetical protein L1D16_21215 [Vibrio sp. Isolate31]|uniref:hypothetical protein n=1 Tax=unclassified Vibrio TaxID=2614977 RepID=UPI001EFEDEB8|nr:MULTISPECIES: hypothetical protein [unclassified Vibrio]MCG9553559.1 hypothetical protein [Vibrio sp. Isolate32]MCG9603248.1 hypothetical protein [Vibrio sp. Isolate31]